jgi:tyrosine-specific transport protein
MLKYLANHRVLGGVLLIAGTTLGVGMLAFPTVTSYGGFVPSMVLFVLIWLLMLASSFFFLDVNLSIKGEVNMITMAEKTLGTWGKVLSWVVYLLLLYALTAAYIAEAAPCLWKRSAQDLDGRCPTGWLLCFCLSFLGELSLPGPVK